MTTETYRNLMASYASDQGYPAEAWIEWFDALDALAFDFMDAADFLIHRLPSIAETISCLTVRIEDGKDELLRKVPVKRIEYHTGGWSGAEDLIQAMLKQFWIAHFHTRWERGGHFYFEVPVAAMRGEQTQD
jgi:hypothetical protein